MYDFMTRLRSILAVAVLACFAASASAQPHVIRQSETGSATTHGTWTWDEARKVYAGKWSNGAEATLRVTRVAGDERELVRTDTNGGLTARYVGTKTGDTFRGTVEWTAGNKTWTGTWEGKLEKAAGFGAVLSRAEAIDVFNRMAAQRDIAFKYPTDGCYARAHLMVQRLTAMGVKPGKVWAFARPGTKLTVTTANHPRGEVRWDYHVAPVVRARLLDGTERDLVIDPSMFNAPATVEFWRDAIRTSDAGTTYVTRTRLGEAPVDAVGVRRPGSGYTPGSDPPNIDAHAAGRMQEAFEILAGRKPWPN